MSAIFDLSARRPDVPKPFNFWHDSIACRKHYTAYYIYSFYMATTAELFISLYERPWIGQHNR